MHAPRPDFGEGGGDYPSGIQPVRIPEGGVMSRIVASSVFLPWRQSIRPMAGQRSLGPSGERNNGNKMKGEGLWRGRC